VLGREPPPKATVDGDEPVVRGGADLAGGHGTGDRREHRFRPLPQPLVRRPPRSIAVEASHVERRDAVARFQIFDRHGWARGQTRRVGLLAFSPDGRVPAAAGQERAVTLLESASGKVVTPLTTSVILCGVAFIPDRTQLVVSLFDGGVDAFETTPPYRRRTIQAHQRLVPALAVHPSGQVFATGSEDGLLTLWQTSTLDKLATFDPQFGEVITTVFDPAGRRLDASTAGGMLIRVDIESSNRFVEAHRSRGW
jgi:hypothetical protein